MGGAVRRFSKCLLHKRPSTFDPTRCFLSSGAAAQGPSPTPSTPQLAADAATTAATAASPFLRSLLDPPTTIPLKDATRTYATMDVVPPCAKYDPRQSNVPAVGADRGEDTTEADKMFPLRAAHAAGELWRCCASASPEERVANRPPQWFEALCRDLFYRTGEEGPWPEGSTESGEGDAGPAVVRAEGPADVDPFLWLPFELLDTPAYTIGPYSFPSTATYSYEQRVKLCLGDVRHEYVHFCLTYMFPERHQIPTSVGTVPAKLYMDPYIPAPVVYLQLSQHFPPAMWLPIKGTAAAVRRVLSAYAQMAALHRDWHHSMFEERYHTAVRAMQLQRLPMRDEGDILRYMGYEARNTQFMDAPLREFNNQQEFFLGEHDDPERLLEHLDLSPYLFAIPHMRVVTDPHAEHMIPTVAGTGMVPSVFRCVFSKAVLVVNVMLSAEVKLPPQDPESFHFMWRDSQVTPKMRFPVFARVLWPDNERISAGGILTHRFNKLFQTEFAADLPPDAALALYHAMSWGGVVSDFMGVHGMRQRVAELEAASRLPEPPRLYPGTREIPNPEYTTQERLGMHVQYLSQLGDPTILDTVRRMLPAASAPVRMGCAKATLIAGDRTLFRRIVSSEAPGRVQDYMTKLVRKRKTRDLTDAEPRLLDDQYEFAAPLWTKRGTRIDRNTLEGAADATRLVR